MEAIQNYPGAKSNNGMYQAIINLIPPINTYIEPFVGGGHIVTRLQLPGNVVINDIDASVYQHWQQFAKPGITVSKCDYRSCIDNSNYTAAETLIYFDPPYPLISRRQKQPLYKHEFSIQDHEDFINYVYRQQCKMIISTYPNEMYQAAFGPWRQKQLRVITHRGIATEMIYYNYPTPTELQDYRYTGYNHTDRQRIKRKVDRTIKKILQLPELERSTILKAIENSFPGPGKTSTVKYPGNSAE